MSEEGYSAPITPARKRTARISTGGRKPRMPSPTRYLDLEAVEAVHSGGSESGEDVDRYESDFIDDGDEDLNADGYAYPYEESTSYAVRSIGLPPSLKSASIDTPRYTFPISHGLLLYAASSLPTIRIPAELLALYPGNPNSEHPLARSMAI
ncbi:hypothetical protein B0H14DRAFT_3457886 [Mycena olivaceomarginata]|nr:hypothetical protein B0H14DRAFT_3457886 [Mycena olivaceomarginata]